MQFEMKGKMSSTIFLLPLIALKDTRQNLEFLSSDSDYRPIILYRVKFGLHAHNATYDRVWSPPSLLSNGYQGLFSWG